MQCAASCLSVCIFVRWRFKLSFCITAMADDTGNWGGTRHGVKLDKRLVMCVALSLEFLNISIDTSIQMLSEYDIHVYSFCGQAIQSLVGATFKYCVLIRFITISISMSHSRTSSVYTGVAVSAAPSDIGHHMSGSMYSRGRGPSAACGNRIKVFPLWSGQKE